MGPSLVPGLPKMYCTPSALSISRRACLPVISWERDIMVLLRLERLGR